MTNDTNPTTLPSTPASPSLADRLRSAPRVVAAMTMVGGAAALGLVLLVVSAQTGRVRLTTRGMALVGFGGLFIGFGLGQLLWPPRKPEPGEQTSGWARGTTAQKVVWCLGATVGVVAAAIVGTAATGNI